MTLRQFYDYLSAHPLAVTAFFLFPPLVAAFANRLAAGRGYRSPWREVYAALVYLVAVPGILSATLLVYLFLFERQSAWDLDVVTQLLPIASMTVTFLLIRRNVDLAYVPGFRRLSGLLGMIAALLAVMFVAEHFRWVTFTYLPASAVLVGFALLLGLAMWGWLRLSRAR